MSRAWSVVSSLIGNKASTSRHAAAHPNQAVGRMPYKERHRVAVSVSSIRAVLRPPLIRRFTQPNGPFYSAAATISPRASLRG